MVLKWSERKYVRAIINSFQLLMKVIIATVMTAGLVTDAIILNIAPQMEHPSIKADSSKARGTVFKNPENTRVLNGNVKAT